MPRLMASLSVSRKSSLVAGPLGTLPRFGESTCAQDAVVARNSSINVHNASMPGALSLEWPMLSALGVADIRLFPCCILILILCMVFLFPRALPSLFSFARGSSNSGIPLIFIRRRVSTDVFTVPSQRLGVGPGYNSAGHVQQECTIGARGVLYSAQHECATGEGTERRNDFCRIDLPKRPDLIVGKPVIITVFGG